MTHLLRCRRREEKRLCVFLCRSIAIEALRRGAVVVVCLPFSFVSTFVLDAKSAKVTSHPSTFIPKGIFLCCYQQGGRWPSEEMGRWSEYDTGNMEAEGRW